MYIELPHYDFRVRSEAGKRFVFDALRKRFVVLTPEEWVRQNLIRYLIEEMAYPKGRLSIERGLRAGGRFRRSDLVVHRSDGSAWMLVECKAPGVRLDQSVMDQAARYNASLLAPWIVLFDGRELLLAEVDYASGRWRMADALPSYPV